MAKMIFHFTDFLSQIIIGILLGMCILRNPGYRSGFRALLGLMSEPCLVLLAGIMEMYGQFIVMRQAYREQQIPVNCFPVRHFPAEAGVSPFLSEEEQMTELSDRADSNVGLRLSVVFAVTGDSVI